MNREHAYLRAVFNELIRLEQWKRDNPLSKLRAFKVQERELSYLSTEQIRELLDALDDASNPHLGLMARVCLETGARWGEAEGLRISQLRDGVIQFAFTKSSKTRAVPIRTELASKLVSHHKAHSKTEQFFDASSHRWAFREAIKGTSLKLPEGQLTHVLRHTFASHFMMNGGNILALQKLLGHQSLTMTMRYAHLSPDHLAEARKLNPLASLEV